MKAIAVFSVKAGSVHLVEVTGPSVRDVPKARGVLVKILRVGVDGKRTFVADVTLCADIKKSLPAAV
jgi:hypothetical protein